VIYKEPNTSKIFIRQGRRGSGSAGGAGGGGGGGAGGGPWPPWTFIHGPDIVDGGLIVLFFGLFSVGPPGRGLIVLFFGLFLLFLGLFFRWLPLEEA